MGFILGILRTETSDYGPAPPSPILKGQNTEDLDSHITTTDVISLVKGEIITFQIIHSARDDLRRSGVGFHPKIKDGTPTGCPEKGAASY